MAQSLLVTGATGFIGRAVAIHAGARGWAVTGACRKVPDRAPDGVRWATFEECEQGQERYDAIVHCAAVRHRHGVGPQEYERVNLELTRRVLDLARRRAGRLVHVSSIAVYGWPRALPIDETRPYQPIGPYGASKVRSEEMVRASGVPFVIVQPSITYGPGDTNGMIDKMFRMIASGFFVLPGLGLARVQLVYVGDLAGLVVDSTTSSAAVGETFICTHREPVRVRDLVREMARIVRRPVLPVGPPVALLHIAGRMMELAEALHLFRGEPPLTREKLATIAVDRAYAIDKLRRLLGREPVTSLSEGLRLTAQAMGLTARTGRSR